MLSFNTVSCNYSVFYFLSIVRREEKIRVEGREKDFDFSWDLIPISSMCLTSRSDRRGLWCRIFVNRKIDLGFVKESVTERTLDTEIRFVYCPSVHRQTPCTSCVRTRLYTHTHTAARGSNCMQITHKRAHIHTRAYVIYA